MSSKGSWRALLAGLMVTAMGLFSASFANDELLELQEDPSLWVIPNANYEGWNYSPLDQINTENVDQLEVKWTFQTGVLDSHEAQPIVIDNTMYLLTPKPNTLIALDLENEGFVKWVFAPEMDTERAGGLACCGAQTRGMAYADGKIIFNTLDGQLFAVDKDDGSVVWQEVVADLDIGETTTTFPLIVGNNVIIGNEGGERGVRGWVAAYDLQTGEEQWKFYNTGPDEEMGITDRFQPFYEVDQVENVGVESWYRDSWQHGGGTSWGWWTYDPGSNLFYYGTANCAPWNPDYRRDPATAPGFEEYGNKYCASVIARDAETGEMAWAYSTTPQDQWDFDEPGQNFVVDLEIDGEMRETLVRPARNGFFYIQDRHTGELLVEPWAYTNTTWADSVDMETGLPNFNPDAIAGTDITIPICPYIAGNNWQNDAYSPDTGLVYFAAEHQCGQMTGMRGEYEHGANYVLMGLTTQGVEQPEVLGELQAWDPVTGEMVWSIEHTATVGAKPLSATGGNLILTGTDQGTFQAIDARNGEVLYEFRTGSDFRNSAITYIGPDGNQYIALIASQGPGNPQVDEDTPADAAGRFRRSGSTLFVFGLSDSALEQQAGEAEANAQ